MAFIVAATGRAWSEPATESISPDTRGNSAETQRAHAYERGPALWSLLERRQRLRIALSVERRPRPALVASVPRALPITARPGTGRVVGQMPAGSPFYGVPTVAWIHRRSGDGRYGRVTVPYSPTRASGWIKIAGLKLSRTPYAVRADLSRHTVSVTRLGKTIMRFPAATGAPASPTPPGRYFVTDRVPFSPSSPLGSFAFGISGIQPQLPPGWRGGDQLAIHGTNDPGSIGNSVSAGCLRVSAQALERLKPVLRLGTPVIIRS
jgi:lipoprotein-anchoring transpeptidase ErfK/SrfK